MLDWQRIDELRNEIGDEDFAEVAEIFLEELEEVIGKLAKGGTTEETRDRLHFLKGCALNLGFAGLAQTALASETGGLDSNALQAAYANSRAEFCIRTNGSAAA